ncbi:hypothetical protein BS47DRAFT_222536 [Hydnum rufescens UP504]|uniref:Uncharacterized protein n=1 Tax=Hydnum rufescens UP504 TaxID=1448309 RepID=A0A9P6B9A7_9AGAM|nr:hypothetical protein BS47DRAFT_222536 [Hydnum rufescens UP504]
MSAQRIGGHPKGPSQEVLSMISGQENVIRNAHQLSKASVSLLIEFSLHYRTARTRPHFVVRHSLLYAERQHQENGGCSSPEGVLTSTVRSVFGPMRVSRPSQTVQSAVGRAVAVVLGEALDYSSAFPIRKQSPPTREPSVTSRCSRNTTAIVCMLRG